MFLIILTLLSALSLSVLGAYVSIVGLTALFAGNVLIIAMIGIVIELGKIVGVSFMWQTWSDISKKLRLWLGSLLLVAMIITSGGVYGFLSKSFLDVQAPMEQNALELNISDTELTDTQDRIEFIDNEIKQFRQELTFLQQAIDNYPEDYASKRIYTYNQQKPRRKEINTTISQLRKDKSGELRIIKKIRMARSTIKQEELSVSSDIGPLKHVASTIGLAEDKAIRILIIMILVVLDPLAITLLLCANILISKKLGSKGGMLDLIKEEDIIEEPIPEITTPLPKPPLTEGSELHKPKPITPAPIAPPPAPIPYIKPPKNMKNTVELKKYLQELNKLPSLNEEQLREKTQIELVIRRESIVSGLRKG